MSNYLKSIASGIGGAATFLELWLTPHTWPWIVVGAILAAGTTAGVWRVENKDPDAPTVPAAVPVKPAA